MRHKFLWALARLLRVSPTPPKPMVIIPVEGSGDRKDAS